MSALMLLVVKVRFMFLICWFALVDIEFRIRNTISGKYAIKFITERKKLNERDVEAAFIEAVNR